MLEKPMINKMIAMRLHGMAEALKAEEQDANIRELSFLERLGLPIDQQRNWRENQAKAQRWPCRSMRRKCLSVSSHAGVGVSPQLHDFYWRRGFVIETSPPEENRAGGRVPAAIRGALNDNC